MSIQALIATRKGLFSLDDQRQLKLLAFDGVPVSMILADAARSSWYAALDHGHFGVKLHRSEDAGNRWQEVEAPAYPAVEDKEQGDSLELIWSLEYADENNDERIWAGTIPGGLFYSDDGGESWRLNAELWRQKCEQGWFGGGYNQPGIHSIHVDGDDPQRLTIGVSVAGVYCSENGGKSWHNRSQGMRAEYMPPDQQFNPLRQDPHRLIVSPSDASVLWAQHHNGIFKSEDGAQSWQEITDVKPSTFGFALAVHPNDADRAWFVPAIKDECRIPVDGKLRVTRTRDGGKNFEILSDGLPDQSYDLVYRHGLDIDRSGEQLLMGSTTGNLWLSTDQGDQWQNISHYLPPVYAVKFII